MSARRVVAPDHDRPSSHLDLAEPLGLSFIHPRRPDPSTRVTAAAIGTHGETKDLPILHLSAYVASGIEHPASRVLACTRSAVTMIPTPATQARRRTGMRYSAASEAGTDVDLSWTNSQMV
jgi:hypothetical protein